MANALPPITTDTVVKLIIRRGADLDRQGIVLASGELGYTIDTKRLYVGDGYNLGGSLAGNLNYGFVNGIEKYIQLAQPGDIVFQNATSSGAADNTLYAFSKNHNWQSIHPSLSAPFDYSTGSLNFDPKYLKLDSISRVFHIYGDVKAYTIDVNTLSASIATIYNQPIYGTDGVNLLALLSGVETAELYTRNYSNGFYVPLSGKATMRGTLSSTTNVSVSTWPINKSDLSNKDYVDSLCFRTLTAAEDYTSNRFLPLTGGTLTDSLTSAVITNNSIPAVLIRQLGTGPALRIDDTNFDTSPFIIDSYGSVGIGGVPVVGGTTQLSVFGTVSATGNTTLNSNLYALGNVGIGTSSPATKLHVEGGTLGTIAGNTLEIARFTDKDANINILKIYQNRLASGNTWTTAETRLQAITDVTPQGYISFNPDGTGGLSLGAGTPSVEALRVDGATQFVGIGASPSYRLDVQGGNASFQNAANTNNEVDIFLGPQTGGSVQGYIYGDKNRMGFYSGISQSSLSIGKTNTNPNVTINAGTGTSANFNVAVNGNSNVLYANSTGKVGIGTATPNSKLHVEGNTYINGTLTTTGAINSQGDITAFYTSDARLKSNIKPITSALDKIDSINGVEYDWNTVLQADHIGHDVGVIAQEIEQVLPEAVTTRTSGYKAVNYDKIIPLLLQAIKELKAEVQSLKK